MMLFDQSPEIELPPAREKFAYVMPNGRVVFECLLTEAEADEKNANLEKLLCFGRYCKRENFEFLNFAKEEAKTRTYQLKKF